MLHQNSNEGILKSEDIKKDETIGSGESPFPQGFNLVESDNDEEEI